MAYEGSFSICTGCLRPAARCEPKNRRGCRCWNQPLAQYCRGCGIALPRDDYRNLEDHYRNTVLTPNRDRSTTTSTNSIVLPDRLADLGGTDSVYTMPDTPDDLELDSVAGYLWIGETNGAFSLIDPFQSGPDLMITLSRASEWPHDVKQRRWLPTWEGPWLASSSPVGLRVFSLASMVAGSGRIDEYLPNGWRCLNGEQLLAPPVFIEPDAASKPGDRRIYWLTRSVNDELRLYGLDLTLTGMPKEPSQWDLGVHELVARRGAGMSVIRPERGGDGLHLLVIATGHILATCTPPTCGAVLKKITVSKTEFEWDVGQAFSDTSRLFILPCADQNWFRRFGAIGVLNGLVDRRFVRFTIHSNGIQFSDVVGTGHPVGVARLPEGTNWVYINQSVLGHVNTMDQATPCRDLQRLERYDRVHTAGRVVALSGQNDLGKPIIRVFDLLSKITFHMDDWDQAGSLFPLPALIGTALFTIERDRENRFALMRSWLVPSLRPGVRL